MAFVLGLVGGAVRHAIRREKENNQSSYQPVRDLDAYDDGNYNNSTYYHHQQQQQQQQPPCPCLGTHLPQQYGCNHPGAHDIHVPVSRREFKRECRRSRRAERHGRGGAGAYGAAAAVPRTVVYTTTTTSQQHLPNNTAERYHNTGVFHGTASSSSRNITTRAGHDGEEAASAPPVYARNRRDYVDEQEGGLREDDLDAPPPYEQVSVDSGRRRSVEVLTSGSRGGKMSV